MKLLTAVSPVVLLLALGCGSSAPSAQLVDARRAYDQARTSDANQYAPDRVLAARQALDKAERAHQDDAGSFEEKSLAYVAQRQAELAQSYANIAKADQGRQQADATYRQRQDELRRTAESQAETAQQNLGSARQQIAAQGSQLNATQTQLERERTARAEAEKRAAAAMASLAEIARVKEDSRGTIITLDGAVLFVTGKSELLPMAQQKLDSVAKALTELEDEQTVVIEGHTDAQGSDDANMRLSQARADSVRAYLVSKGVKADRIRAVGRGEQQPLASNDSPEGRANNRRVEIVIQPAPQRSGGATPAGGTQPPTGTAPAR